jgi:hypothetical protein
MKQIPSGKDRKKSKNKGEGSRDLCAFAWNQIV